MRQKALGCALEGARVTEHPIERTGVISPRAFCFVTDSRSQPQVP